MDRLKVIGILCTLAWAILNAAKDVTIGSFVQNFPPMLLSFFMAFIAFIFFGLLHTRESKKTYHKVKKSFRPLLIINICSVAIWVLSVFSLKWLEPAVAGAVGLSAVPLTTVLLQPYLRKHKPRTKRDFIAAIGIILGVIVSLYFTLSGNTALGEKPPLELILGFIFTIGTGVAISINSFFSKDLYDAGWSPKNILFLRVPLVVLAVGTYCLMKFNFFEYLNSNNVLFLFLICFLGVIPVLFSQTALKLLETNIYSQLICLLPVFSIFFQLFDGRLEFSWFSIFGIGLIISFVFYGATARQA